jgi:hypothetical protein
MKPQDVVVLLALGLPDRRGLTYAGLAAAVAMSPSEVHAAVRRNAAAGLLDPVSRRPLAGPVMEFLVHGLRYVFPAVRGEPTRGLPTGYAAPVMAAAFADSGEPPPVWPYAGDGAVRGITFEPLCANVPAAAVKDPRLYGLLALTDALRGGRARERRYAEVELHRLLKEHLQ